MKETAHGDSLANTEGNYQRTRMQEEMLFRKLRDMGCQDVDSKSTHMKPEKKIVCVIELDDHTFCSLSAREWDQVVAEGLKNCGYANGQNITNIRLFSCPEIRSCN